MYLEAHKAVIFHKRMIAVKSLISFALANILNIWKARKTNRAYI